MNNPKLRIVGLSAGLLTMAVSATAFAQEATAGGQARVGATAQVGMGLPGATPQAAIAAPAAGGTDHSMVVGHLAVGYLGLAGVPVGATINGGATAIAPATTVDAPVIGVRYWLDPFMGLDLGLGFGIQSGSVEAGGVSGDQPGYWAFAVHGGLPLALASGRHYTFEIIPEANIGLGGGSADPDIKYKGFLLNLGARAGAEIQFGFIGLPELALQGSIGALFALSSSSTDNAGAKVSRSNLSFGTTVYNSPWALFTNSISALYYF